MPKITEWMDRTLYPSFGDRWDNLLFRAYLLNILKPGYSCLDYGAGRGNVEEMDFRPLGPNIDN